MIEETLKLWRQSKFTYGVSDCLMSVGEYITRCGGLDIPARFRGTYDDEAGAMRHVADHGGPEGILRLFELPEIEPIRAQRGDVVIINPSDGGTPLAGICTGQGIAARTERSVIEVSRRFVTVTHAWRITPCLR